MASVPEPEHDDLDGDEQRTPLGGLKNRGVRLLPNLFTTGVLFCGFYAIVQAMNGFFQVAAIAVFVAMVLDGMDGRVARWTHTASEFGAQYDSIADMVAFGAAPALIAYIWALQDLTLWGLGWIAAFIHCAGAAIRLARFNVNIGVVDKRFFQGLPSPSGAAVVAGLVWAMTDFGFEPQGSPWLIYVTFVVAIFTGFTMVSNVPFHSFKEFNWRRRVPLWVILAVVLAFAIISTQPSLVLFVLILSYALSGYVMWAMGHRIKSVLPDD